MDFHLATQRFVEIANEAISRDQQTGIFSLEQELKELVFESDALAHFTRQEISSIAANPDYESRAWDGESMFFAGNERWSLRAGFCEKSSDHLYTIVSNMMIAVIGSQPLIVNHHELPASINNEIYDPAIKLSPPRRETYLPGEVLKIDCERETVDLLVSVPAALVVKFTMSPSQSLQWAFARDDLSAIQAIAGNSVDSELVSLAQTLGAMSSVSSIATLLELTAHKRHFVRWAALQALAKIDPDRMPSLLRIATVDAHPHIRSAAFRAIEKMRAGS